MISKSGTTTEPGISFRIFKDLLEKKKVILQGIKDRRAELNIPHDDSVMLESPAE